MSELKWETRPEFGPYLPCLQRRIKQRADQEFHRHVHRELIDSRGITIAKWIPDQPQKVVAIVEPLMETIITIDWTHL